MSASIYHSARHNVPENLNLDLKKDTQIPQNTVSTDSKEMLHYVGNILRYMDRHSSVGIATGYGLDGPGIESRWGGRDFPHLSRPALGPTQPPVQWVPGLSLG